MRTTGVGSWSPGDLVEVQSPRGETGLAFLPDELPADVTVDATVARKLEHAGIALGNLNGLGRQLLNPWVLVNPFVRREALASTRIEGTRADFGQLALFEAANQPESDDPDIQEVVNYVRALGNAWNADPGWVLTATAVRSLHRVLLEGVRGRHATPGEFRDVPVFIGRATDTLVTPRFVPAPHADIPRLLDNLNAYVAGDQAIPSLVKLAIAHYQFETIHPFRDGNGRLGRMLIPLYLKYWGILDFPLLYLSEYFERERDTYLDLLFRVSRDGDWTAWIHFFLEAIHHQARDAVVRSRVLLDLRESLRARYQGERSPRIVQTIDELFLRPSLTTTSIQESLGISKSTANQIVNRLEVDGILEEITGKERYKVYLARPIMDAITAGSTPGTQGVATD